MAKNLTEQDPAGTLLGDELLYVVQNNIDKKALLSDVAPVRSVAGRTGTVTLAHTDISGLGSLATQNGTFSGTSSGTNTGDETDSSIKTKLGITTLSGSNTGDQDLSGYALTNDLGTAASEDVGYAEGNVVVRDADGGVLLNGDYGANVRYISSDTLGLLQAPQQGFLFTTSTDSIVNFIGPSFGECNISIRSGGGVMGVKNDINTLGEFTVSGGGLDWLAAFTYDAVAGYYSNEYEQYFSYNGSQWILGYNGFDDVLIPPAGTNNPTDISTVTDWTIGPSHPGVGAGYDIGDHVTLTFTMNGMGLVRRNDLENIKLEFISDAGVGVADALNTDVTNAGCFAGPLDVNSKLPASQIPDELDVRLQILSDTSAGLDATALGDNEVVINEDTERLEYFKDGFRRDPLINASIANHFKLLSRRNTTGLGIREWRRGIHFVTTRNPASDGAIYCFANSLTGYFRGLNSDGTLTAVVPNGDQLDFTLENNFQPKMIAIFPCSVSGIIDPSDASPGFTTVDMTYSHIVAVNFNKQLSLTTVILSGNDISDIDVSRLNALVTLNLTQNALSAITLPAAPNCTTIQLSDNAITNLTIPEAIGDTLEVLNVQNNNMTTIDVQYCKQIRELSVANNALTYINLDGAVSRNTAGTQNTAYALNNNAFSDAAINTIFTNIGICAETTASRTLSVANNPGAATCNTALIAGKNWTVITA